MLAPVTDGKDFHYSLFIQPLSGQFYDYRRIIDIFEGELRKNYHYKQKVKLNGYLGKVTQITKLQYENAKKRKENK